MIEKFRRKCSMPLLAAALTTVVLGVAATTAAGSADIEGVWSFNGGTVDVQGQAGGVFRGVVVSPTRFAQCSHPVNEDMWSEIRAQGDGSYWGLHQWYFEGQPCVANPQLGPTAWRVLQGADGSRVLRVCFSAPGSGVQPTIAPSGAHANVTFGCVDSASIASLPTSPTKTEGALKAFEKAVILPSAAKCVRRGKGLTIKLRNPKYDPFKRVVVRVNGKKVLDLRNARKLGKPIHLKRVPAGAFTVRVLAITVLNHRLTGSRAYNSCKASGKVGLHKKRRHKRRGH